MPNHITNIIKFQGDENEIKKMLTDVQYEKFGLGSVDFEKIIPMPENIFKGMLGQTERALYGDDNWYYWSIKHWKKWNSYCYDDYNNYQNDNTIRFETAWTAPHPVLAKLSEMYPDIGIFHQWADEDIGHNCGEREYKSGKITGENLPTDGSVEAYNFSADVLDLDLKEEGFHLSPDGSEYVYSEEQKEGINLE